MLRTISLFTDPIVTIFAGLSFAFVATGRKHCKQRSKYTTTHLTFCQLGGRAPASVIDPPHSIVEPIVLRFLPKVGELTTVLVLLISGGCDQSPVKS